jgi:hypothetical protein
MRSGCEKGRVEVGSDGVNNLDQSVRARGDVGFELQSMAFESMAVL